MLVLWFPAVCEVTWEVWGMLQGLRMEGVLITVRTRVSRNGEELAFLKNKTTAEENQDNSIWTKGLLSSFLHSHVTTGHPSRYHCVNT